jgi:hypothetical protein
MGRYSTLQTPQTEKNTIVVNDSSYSQLLPKVTEDVSVSNKVMKTGDNKSVTGKRLIVNKVDNVSGSCAGAGSSEFDIYRKSRRREQEYVCHI